MKQHIPQCGIHIMKLSVLSNFPGNAIMYVQNAIRDILWAQKKYLLLEVTLNF